LLKALHSRDMPELWRVPGGELQKTTEYMVRAGSELTLKGGPTSLLYPF